MTVADKLLHSVFAQLGILSDADLNKYAQIGKIIDELQKIHVKKPINVKTTGTISERLCALGLGAIPSVTRRRFGQDWQCVGDILVPGHPYDIAISIKSFKAKERLLASGTGSLLAPIIG